MFSKVDVNGDNAHPIYKYLRTVSDIEGGKIGWNFGKFLVNK
jgi:glutathione peroxidase